MVKDFTGRLILISKKESGFTLIEVIVTIAIGSILLLVVSALLVNTLVPYMRQNTDIVMVSELRYAEMVIEKELRRAYRSVNIPGGSANNITFVDIYGNTVIIRENAGTDEIELVKSGTEAIMQDVTSLNFTEDRDWRGYLVAVDVTITQTKVVRSSTIGISPTTAGGASVTKSNTDSFKVYLTNVLKGI